MLLLLLCPQTLLPLLPLLQVQTKDIYAKDDFFDLLCRLCLLCPQPLLLLPLLQVPAKDTYAKDDFFDQLSCDTLERLQVHEEGGGGCWLLPQQCTGCRVLAGCWAGVVLAAASAMHWVLNAGWLLGARQQAPFGCCCARGCWPLP